MSGEVRKPYVFIAILHIAEMQIRCAKTFKYTAKFAVFGAKGAKGSEFIARNHMFS